MIGALTVAAVVGLVPIFILRWFVGILPDFLTELFDDYLAFAVSFINLGVGYIAGSLVVLKKDDRAALRKFTLLCILTASVCWLSWYYFGYILSNVNSFLIYFIASAGKGFNGWLTLLCMRPLTLVLGIYWVIKGMDGAIAESKPNGPDKLDTLIDNVQEMMPDD